MEQGTPEAEGPGTRLLRLWLWSAPLLMLALASLFAVIAVDEERWALLAVMVVLALVAVSLFVLQWRLLRKIAPNDGGQTDDTTS
jgi:predicted lysophospholipase L1 biosynthesis ABC-type transport system permease subunit